MTSQGQKVAYIRVSTVDQNLARQREALAKYGIDRWYEEKVSGKDMDRPQLMAMLDFVREGDTVYIHDFSRLARSTIDLLSITDQLTAKGVHLVSNKENLDTSTPSGRLMLTMIAAINEFERLNLLERQAEGIAIAKANGIYKGRAPIRMDIAATEEYRLYADHVISKAEMSRRLGISRKTLDKLMMEQGLKPLKYEGGQKMEKTEESA